MFVCYNGITRNQTTNERRAVTTNEQTEQTPCRSREPKSVYAYCDHCGFAIYDARDALIMRESRDRIHIECFSEYIEEHMFDVAEGADVLTAELDA